MNISKLSKKEMFCLQNVYFKQKKRMFVYAELSDEQSFAHDSYFDEMIYAYLTDSKTAPQVFCGKPVYNIFDVLYYEPNSYFIIVDQPNKNNPELFKVLSSMIGLSAYKDYIYLNIAGFGVNYSEQYRDPQLAFNRYYNEWDNKYPGFKIFGKPNSKLKILTLGGCTTDPLLCDISSWSECLYYDFKKRGFDVSVFCGGFSGYVSYQELQKLLRDGLSIKPDIVISYSGLNDLTYQVYNNDLDRDKRHYLNAHTEKLFKWLTDYEGTPAIFGMKTDKDACQYWIQNETIMNAICEKFDIKHSAIFQPSPFHKGNEPKVIVDYFKYIISNEEDPFYRRSFLEHLRYFVKEVETSISDIPYISNFGDIFDDIDPLEVYYDHAHVYECGNEIIAANVFEELLKRGHVLADTTHVGEVVLDFYKQLPFNQFSSINDVHEQIMTANTVPYIFPSADEEIKSDTRVLELGCGVGWLSNMIAYYYKCSVDAVDFNSIATDFGKEVSLEMNLNVQFVTGNLFEYSANPYDVVISNGVLHHTGDCHGGITKVCSLVKHGGIAVVGLYHEYGRRPFLDYFDNLRKSGATEKELIEKYRELDSRARDEITNISWYRDQVIHPHETQHTLKEIYDVFEKCNMKLVSTSINKFNEIINVKELFEQEKLLYNEGLEILQSGNYYPGLFITIWVKD